MNTDEIIEAFYGLGKSLKAIPEYVIETAHISNNWFTPLNIKIAGEKWSLALSEANIHNWFQQIVPSDTPKKIGIIMAGNIPFVGLHDLLCVLAKGHHAVVKLSSNDEVLMGHAIAILRQFSADIDTRITLTDSLKGIDALIATGSNNSSRYFEHYFRNVPTLIRKNRTSIAVLSGNETDEELTRLSDDIYIYFGLGCRNVTHLLLPNGFELKRMYEAFDKYIDIVNHHKYYNNYMYHKSILLMNLSKHYDNGFMLFQEKEELHAPIATLNYHYYTSNDQIDSYIHLHQDSLQCVITDIKLNIATESFGNSQSPGIEDYADKVNTIEFLNKV